MTRSVLRMYIVYDSPSDMPGHIVMRGVSVHSDGRQLFDRDAVGWRFGEVRTHEAALEAARKACAAMGLVRLGRHPDDAPAIVETWL